MKICVLGATGAIGSAVLSELISAGHTVVALSRSEASTQKLLLSGAVVHAGDLRKPEEWCGLIHDVDAIIHVAATWSDDMGEVDANVISTLVDEAAKSSQKIRFLYTGGCWLYGATRDQVADESTPFNPISAFKWMVDNAKVLVDADCFSTAVVHPAMSYSEEGGVFTRFIQSAEQNKPIEVWGDLNTRWPLIHRNDLARAYRMIVEDDVSGEHYNVAAETGVPVRKIVAAIENHYGSANAAILRPVEDVIAQHGTWALGPTLDQQMSSNKLRSKFGWVPEWPDFQALLQNR